MKPIASREELVHFLESDLGYCPCAYTDAEPLLLDFLRRVNDRSGVHEFLDDNASPGLRSWFIYLLEKADLISHGFNVEDLLIMRRGEWLLKGLEQFPPQDDEDEEADSTTDSA